MPIPKKLQRTYYRNVAAKILSDAACFLINPSFLVFKNRKTATSFITLNIIVVFLVTDQLNAQILAGAPDGHLQSVMIPDAVQYNSDLLMMSTTVPKTSRGI